MANKGRPHGSPRNRPNSGRVTPAGSRPRTDTREPRSGPGPQDDVADPFVEILEAVSDDDPIEYLAHASSLVNAFDRRNDDPFAGSASDQDGGISEDDVPDAGMIVDMLTRIPVPSAPFVLTGLAALLPDEVLAAKCRRALGGRRVPMPSWLAQLDQATVTGVYEQVHVLGDGDNIIFGVELAGGHAFTVVVYIDHNLGHVCKDAFPMEEALDDAIAMMRTVIDDPDVTWTPLDGATARARVADAIERGAMTWPPYESDSWPAARPLVEWLLTRLPGGGTGYDVDDAFEERVRQAEAEMTAAFFASEFGRAFDDADHRSMFESLCWFGGSYGSCDLLQWSPVRVELLLADWLPRKVMAPFDYLAKAPALLEAFVRFAHAERGIATKLTDETLAAVGLWTPVFLERISDTDRPTGATAIALAALGGDTSDTAPLARTEGDDDITEIAQSVLEGGLDIDGLSQLADAGIIDDDLYDQLHSKLLDRHFATFAARRIEDALASVGGPDILDSLTTEPLPDESMDWTGIADELRPAIEAVLVEVDRVCDEVLDVEYRTACRRFVAAAALGDPAVFARRAKPANTAAAACWVVAKTNALVNPSPRGSRGQALRMTVGELMAQFGVSSAAQRGRVLLGAVTGGDRDRDLDAVGLGDVRYLVSARRAELLDQVTRARAWLAPSDDD